MTGRHAARAAGRGRTTVSVAVALLLAVAVTTAAATAAVRHRGARTAEVAEQTPTGTRRAAAPVSPPAASTPPATGPVAALPGMPPPVDPTDLYAADRPGALSPVVRHDITRVYVPNNFSNTVSVIDPATFKVLSTVRVPAGPEHVVPAYDLRTLWVNSDRGNALTPIDPVTGKFGKPVAVSDPYNLYFTPDGRFAVVMAERMHEIDFRDAHTMALVHAMHVPCGGVNHADFSADGRYMIVSCEFSGDLLKVDVAGQRVTGQLKLPGRMPMPQDVKVSPDGRTWYVADMDAGGVWVLDGDRFTTPRLLATGLGAHGLYVSRDSRFLYVTNRGEGSISVVRFADGAVVAKWQIPGGGSPDMGGISTDGSTLWLSGRYNGVVYAISTADGHLIRKIPVGDQPHGLCVWPQPGRYSLGHTGVLR